MDLGPGALLEPFVIFAFLLLGQLLLFSGVAVDAKMPTVADGGKVLTSYCQKIGPGNLPQLQFFTSQLCLGTVDLVMWVVLASSLMR